MGSIPNRAIAKTVKMVPLACLALSVRGWNWGVQSPNDSWVQYRCRPPMWQSLGLAFQRGISVISSDNQMLSTWNLDVLSRLKILSWWTDDLSTLPLLDDSLESHCCSAYCSCSCWLMERCWLFLRFPSTGFLQLSKQVDVRTWITGRFRSWWPSSS